MKFYQRRFIARNPAKYNGDPTRIFSRSSWEWRVMKWLDTNENIRKWSSEEHVIPYLCPTDNKWHRYFPDFWFETLDGRIYLVELKPKKQTKPPEPRKRMTKTYINEVMQYGKNEAKWKAAEEYCRQKGWTFKVITEQDLGIGQKR